MKVLVTGSSGHLGEALVRSLLSKGHHVTSIDLLPGEFTTHVGSILDRELIRSCMTDCDTVLHSATLHKPHVATHTHQDFVDVNISGTLNLLEEAVRARVKSFIYTSTTSSFGDALTPPAGAPAAWITEDVVPVPKNIYGVTKTAAEDLCRLFHRNKGLPCIVLRTSRFFLEEDDQEDVRQHYADANTKANEFLYRRVDIEDVVSAHFCAMDKAGEIGFNRYIISATTPFTKEHLTELAIDAPAVVRKLFPTLEAVYEQQGWKMFPKIGRVYVNESARNELGWRPQYDFNHVLQSLANGEPIMSPLARTIGIKGYHHQKFDHGPYPV